jgi:uncharacterized protein YbjT (DUF2867 family)
MRILVCGAGGFIGSAIARALHQAGHDVVHGTSPRRAARQPDGSAVPMDFATDTSMHAWLPRLAGMDAVVNAVGILRDTPARPMAAVHEAAPMALFDACAASGVRRVVHVSALGIADNSTRYARTKRTADEHLLAATQAGRLDGMVLRPSIVFGRGGDSSALFMRLARLPLLWLPGPVLRARVQPLAVADLAEAVAALMGPARSRHGMAALAGPQALALGAFIASLRSQTGRPPARTMRLPDLLTRHSARLGDVLPFSPWCSETLSLLATDNVADPAVLEDLLGRPAVHFSRLVEEAWT